jgi:hypothetical protein
MQQQMTKQLQQMQPMQQKPPHGANLVGPELVTKAMNSTRKDLEKPRSFEPCSQGVPTQTDIGTIVGGIHMLEEQNSVLSQIVSNIIQGRYQGLSQTSLADGLSHSLTMSMVEQVIQSVGGSYKSGSTQYL